MNLFGILEISGSAMQAQRQRAEVVTSNLANAETTRTPQGGPYRRQSVVFAARRIGSFAGMMATFGSRRVRGVSVERVVEDPTPPIQRFNPSHPDADEQGYVAYPAVNPMEEIVNLMGATRAYQLNASAVQATKTMIQESLKILG